MIIRSRKRGAIAEGVEHISEQATILATHYQDEPDRLNRITLIGESKKCPRVYTITLYRNELVMLQSILKDVKL